MSILFNQKISRATTPSEIIENCIREITTAGLAKEISYSIGGQDILLYVKVNGCIHIAKETTLRQRGIKIYNCPIINMILDQIIEKLNFETTYVADIEVDERKRRMPAKVRHFRKPGKNRQCM